MVSVFVELYLRLIVRVPLLEMEYAYTPYEPVAVVYVPDVVTLIYSTAGTENVEVEPLAF